MLDTLIREISARWGLADQGRPLVQMLVAYISNPATGGLTGFLDKFRKAGWGGMVNTWVGNSTTPELPTTAQVQTVFGTGSGFLDQVSTRLGLSQDKVTAAVAGVLPMLVNRMTPDGTVPAVLPAEFGSFAREGNALLSAGTGAAATAAGARRAATATATSVPSSSGTMGKWLPWILGALIVIFGVSYCSKTKEPVSTTVPAPENAPLAPTQPVAPEAPPVTTPEPVMPPAAQPDHNAPDNDASTTADVPTAASQNFTAPEGAGVIDDMHNGMPVLRVFFDSGKTDVAPEFAEKAQSLVAFLKANPDVTAVISGFNDPTGDPARNAELSKQRAQAVKAALESAGIAADRAVMEKPAETTDTGVSNAASRRVDVMLRR